MYSPVFSRLIGLGFIWLVHLTVPSAHSSDFGNLGLIKTPSARFSPDGTLSATLSFDDDKKYVTITDGVTQFKYYFSDIDILTVPTKDIALPCSDIQFTLTLDQLNQLRKASATLKTNQLSIRKNDSASFIECVIVDKQNPTSNQFSMNISNCSINTSADFDLVIDMNNFKFNRNNCY